MERVLYESLKKGENSWWYRGRTAAVRALLAGRTVPSGPVLDFGAGYGAMLPLLSHYGSVTAYEVDADCLTVCQERGYVGTLSSMEQLATKHGYALIGAFDVLEHIEDDAAAVRTLRDALVDDGVLIATVPAHPFLWSEHDVLNHHVRRYRRNEFISLLKENGFVIERVSYWNALLFPVAVVMRACGKGGKEGLVPAAPINAALTLIVLLEALWLRVFSFPIGISLVVRARKVS